MWPGLSHNIWEWNQRNFGLAVTWGLTHLDCLEEKREEEEGMTDREKMQRAHARAQEQSEARMRELIRHA